MCSIIKTIKLLLRYPPRFGWDTRELIHQQLLQEVSYAIAYTTTSIRRGQRLIRYDPAEYKPLTVEACK